jgi:hypothetical protein
MENENHGSQRARHGTADTDLRSDKKSEFSHIMNIGNSIHQRNGKEPARLLDFLKTTKAFDNHVETLLTDVNNCIGFLGRVVQNVWSINRQQQE